MKKMTCDFCQENLEFINHKYLCPICEREWNEIIIKGKNYFDADCIENVNPILALEYQSLDSLLQNKQIYGIILQIKDIYEVIIRIPVLLVCSYVLSGDRTIKGKELLVYLMSKPLSLGDWRYLLSLSLNVIEENPNDIPPEIKMLVETVKTFVNSDKNGDIVYWRNSTISHGAIKQLEDPSLYDDASTKLEELTNFIKKNEALFHDISFVDEKGVELGEGNVALNEKRKVFLKIKDKMHPLYPFFTIKNEGIFLFDRYLKRIRRTDIIDYVKSSKESVVFEELNNLSLENSIDLFNVSANIDMYAVEERDLCEEIANGNEFLPPDFLIDLLKNELKKKKSVFSLQMDKGMGKSYFVKGLDPFSLSNIHIDNLATKAFYINSTYNSRINDFCICVEDLMRKRSSGFTIANSIIRLNVNSKEPNKEFANFLNEYKRKYYSDKELLFVFDGIDELKIQEGKNITDFVPECEDLMDGVFVLITLRNDSMEDRLSPFVRNYMSNFKGLKYSFTKTNKEYIAFSKRYYNLFFVKKLLVFCKKNKIDNDIDVDKMGERFYEIKDNSLLNLNLVKELTLLNLTDYVKKNGNLLNSNTISFGSDMYASYFKSIKEYYGFKYYEKFVNVLCCLAIADRSLSLEELSVLSGNDNLSFAFLGFINSMKMFLDTSRDNKGTMFSIGHTERKKVVLLSFEREINDLKEQIISRIQNVSNNAFLYNNTEDNIFYVCISFIVNGLNPKIPSDCLIALNLFKSMLELPFDFNWGVSRSELVAELDVLINIACFEKFSFELNREQKFRFFMILSKIAFNEMILNNRCISEQFFEKAINFYKDENKDMNQRGWFAETLSFYATQLWNSGNNNKAYAMYKEVVDIKRKINQTNKQFVSDVDFLSECVCLSNIANSAHLYDEQFKTLKYVEKKLPLCEESEKKERTRPFMDACFFSYYRDINDVENAKKYIKKAIEGYDVCCHNAESRMYIPDLVKCIYRYINYIDSNNLFSNKSLLEENYFTSLINYIVEYRDYKDPYSFMEYLFSLYSLYKAKYKDGANRYKKEIVEYYSQLDDEYKESERFIEIIESVKKGEGKDE